MAFTVFYTVTMGRVLHQRRISRLCQSSKQRPTFDDLTRANVGFLMSVTVYDKSHLSRYILYRTRFTKKYEVEVHLTLTPFFEHRENSLSTE